MPRERHSGISCDILKLSTHIVVEAVGCEIVFLHFPLGILALGGIEVVDTKFLVKYLVGTLTQAQVREVVSEEI